MKLLKIKSKNKNAVGSHSAFTLVEIIVVLVIIAIASLAALPMMTAGAEMQLKSAANMIAADLEYAKNLAITRQEKYSVVFSTDGDSYEILNSVGTPVTHSLRNNRSVIAFPSDGRTSRVDIVTANFDSAISKTITFDYFGSPYSGTSSPLVSQGQIQLKAGSTTMTVRIEPVTAYITITTP